MSVAVHGPVTVTALHDSVLNIVPTNPTPITLPVEESVPEVASVPVTVRFVTETGTDAVSSSDHAPVQMKSCRVSVREQKSPWEFSKKDTKKT